MLTFKQFLNEKLEPKQVSFGTNPEMDNEKFNSGDDIYDTFFSVDDINYYVVIQVYEDTCEISFKKQGKVYRDNTKWKDQEFTYNYDIEKSSNALKIYNSFIYIVEKFIKQNEFIETITFNGANEKLDKFYSVIIKNKNFNSMIEKLGFKYKLTTKNIHMFERIE